MNDVLAIILAGGIGKRLSCLSEKRAKPAVPFAGKFRIIDFCLSNCVNSGIDNVAVFTQYRPHSLDKHISFGKPWGLDRKRGGIDIIQPYIDISGGKWYLGTADAIYKNIRFLKTRQFPQTLILSGDHIYKMNYKNMKQLLEEKNADLIISAIEVADEDINRFGILKTKSDGRLVEFEEKPETSTSNLASMGIYLFKTSTLIDFLELNARINKDGYDFGNDVIPLMIRKNARIFTYIFNGYWRDVGTIQSYWEANMDMLGENPELVLNDSEWLIFTSMQDYPPLKLGRDANINQSIISEGAIINGTVKNSIISPGVIIESESLVESSIVFNDTYINSNCIINKTIVDKDVIVNKNTTSGFKGENIPNRDFPELLNTGINVIGKSASIPQNTDIGLNCLIFPSVKNVSYKNRFIQSGSTVYNS
jgi:glucose-1-phosphate adenylyltransferase